MTPRPPTGRALQRGSRRLRLAPLRPARPAESEHLDGRAVKIRGEPDPVTVPPFIAWPDYLRYIDRAWEPGQHMALVAMSQSGKTTFARQVVPLRDFVVIFATKARDDSLYKPFEKLGFVIVDSWTPWDWEDNGQRKVIFRPLGPGVRPTPGALSDQADAFRDALLDVFVAGGWCCYFDEVRYLSDNLGLRAQLDLLWLQGSSNNITMVAATQRPVSVPINMFEQATWLVNWRISDRDDRATAAEYAGPLAPVIRATTIMLPKYEFLSVEKYADTAVRSRVDLRAAAR